VERKLVLCGKISSDFLDMGISCGTGMHMSDHDLLQLDDGYLVGLSPEPVRVLLAKALSDFNAARERLAQAPSNSSRPPSSRASWVRVEDGRAVDGGDGDPPRQFPEPLPGGWRPRWWCALLVTLAPVPAITLAAPPPAGWGYQLEAGAVHGWDADLDAGGAVSVDRWSVQARARHVWAGGFSAGLTLGLGERRYDFDRPDLGEPGLAGGAPWENVRDARISAPLLWRPNRDWSLFAIPTVRWNAETGASLGDGVNGGLLAAASYRVNDRLSIGPGFGFFSEIEDDAHWFPVLAIDWRLTETLSVTTGRGFAASRGPGLSMNWEPNNRWAVGFAEPRDGICKPVPHI
jgi:hypothetical protein